MAESEVVGHQAGLVDGLLAAADNESQPQQILRHLPLVSALHDDDVLLLALEKMANRVDAKPTDIVPDENATSDDAVDAVLGDLSSDLIGIESPVESGVALQRSFAQDFLGRCAKSVYFPSFRGFCTNMRSNRCS